MAIIGDSGLAGLVSGNAQANQTNAPQARDNTGTGGANARGGSSDRGEGVIIDLSSAARSVVEAPRDGVNSAPADAGPGDRDVQADRAEARDETADVRAQEADARRDASAERRESVDLQV
ncbi:MULTISPECIES: hypothetical protein [unclassified Iodidimonas]|jgi:hypothetical protein|uniref:hypothetical protein n=1 Tax=unclassified Iodidimonas TaxID=2626145 RepID=UPI002482720D|nr:MULTISPECIES: hypothetical protein [unclassified Iodidimonas]